MIDKIGNIIDSITEIKELQEPSTTELEKYLNRGWEVVAAGRFGYFYLQRKIKLDKEVIELLELIKEYLSNNSLENLKILVNSCYIFRQEYKFDKTLCNLFIDISDLLDRTEVLRITKFQDSKLINNFNVMLGIIFKKYFYD